MAKRKTTRRSPRRRATTTTARRRSYRRKSDSSYIPSAGGTVGLAYANMNAIQTVIGDMSINGVKTAIKQATTPDQLKKTAIYTVGGLLAGEAVKRFAPNVIKKPLGKIAKKVPRVI